MKTKLYREIARRFNAAKNCEKLNNLEWQKKHEAVISHLCDAKLPSGAGIDRGTAFNFEKSSENRLVFRVEFHHMNACGYYDGWTEHEIIVSPCLQFGISVHVTGRDRNDVKEYLGEIFNYELQKEYDA